MKEDNIEEIIVMCINQVVRPDYSPLMDESGDCVDCVPNDKNKECVSYYPINVYVI